MNKKDNVFQNHIYYRIAAASAVFLVYTINLFRVTLTMLEQLPLHPELQQFYDLGLRGRYATVWNIVIQMVYACFALTCDLSVVLNKEEMVPNTIRTYRNTLFYGLVFPVGMFIAAAFWPYYIYDRELVLPRIADHIMSFYDNLIAHGIVAIYAMFELAFIPRDSTKDLYNPSKYVICFVSLYILTIFFTRFVDVGLWPYEILKVTEGSMWFYLVIAHSVFCCFIFYYGQWKIADAIWRHRESLLEKNH